MLAGGALVVVVAIAMLYASLSGGWDDVLDRSHPKPTSKEVVAARARREGPMAATIGTLLEGPVRGALGAGAVVGTAQPTDHRCREGQHNWKIDDPFDLSCELVGRVAVAGDMARFREQVLALHGALLADGWTAGSLHLGTVITSYWDAFGRPWPSPGDAPYTPSSLPEVGYTRGTAAGSGRLGVELAAASDLDRPSPAVGPGQYGVVLTVTQPTFED